MKPKDSLIFFIILLVVSTSVFTLTIYNSVSTQNAYATQYNFDNNSSTPLLLPNSISYNVLLADYGKPNSLVIGNSVYSLVSSVSNNSPVVSILKVTFNQQFSKIVNETITPTLLPVGTTYDGLILYHNIFFTIQKPNILRPNFYNYNENDSFISFTANSIISNVTVPFNNSYTNVINNSVWDYYFPIQEYDNNLYTLRHICSKTSPWYFILSKYSLPDLNLLSTTLISSNPRSATTYPNTYFSLNQSIVRDFIIDNQGHLWLGLYQGVTNAGLSNAKEIFHYAKFDLNSIKLQGTIMNNLLENSSTFNNLNLTIQSDFPSYQLKTVSIQSSLYNIIGISSNRFILEVTSYPSLTSSNIFTGFQITSYIQAPFPIINFLLAGSSIVISVIGIIINYKRLKREKRVQNQFK